LGKIVVIGGGWAGCAASLSAAKRNCKVVLLERTDMLLGTGLVGGIMRNNGRFTAAEELIATGGGELIQVTDSVARHKNINFPGHKHASLYDIAKIEPAVKNTLEENGVDIRLVTRAKDVNMKDNKIESVVTDNNEEIFGDVFVDTTGTAGPIANCTRYGNGCAMCIIRCISYGSRVSIAEKAGIKELVGRKKDGSKGAMSGSCKLHKDSLSSDIIQNLNEKGVLVIPIPKEIHNKEALDNKACQQYALNEYAENIVLLDTGHAKLMSPFYPLETLRTIPGFQNARYEDPYSGNIGNSIRYLAISPRDNSLRVSGMKNLFARVKKLGL